MIRLARRSPLASAGALIVGLVIVAALAAPLLATTDPIDQDLSVALKPPFWLGDGSLRHPLGTDHLGRDVYSRLIYGAQISLTISVLAAFLGAWSRGWWRATSAGGRTRSSCVSRT